ncbi:MAG: hypothetical protein JOZ69_23125, partial [Myxococcales bacterium]|nr:hypothetical protein [Myxococcales bacterium]
MNQPESSPGPVSPVSPPAVGEDDPEPLPPIPKRTVIGRLRAYFLAEDPALLAALVPTCFL